MNRLQLTLFLLACGVCWFPGTAAGQTAPTTPTAPAATNPPPKATPVATGPRETATGTPGETTPTRVIAALRSAGGGRMSTEPLPPLPNTEHPGRSGDWVWVAMAGLAVLLTAAGTMLLLRRSTPKGAAPPKSYDPYA
jgi:hypothetical protein